MEALGAHAEEVLGVGAQSVSRSAKCLSLAVITDQSSAGKEDFRT